MEDGKQAQILGVMVQTQNCSEGHLSKKLVHQKNHKKPSLAHRHCGFLKLDDKREMNGTTSRMLD